MGLFKPQCTRGFPGFSSNGEEERIPKNLKWLVGEDHIELIRQGESKHRKWKLGVGVVGSILPIIMLCSATVESFIPRLLVIFVSAVLFFMGVALLEWLLRPQSQ